MIDIISLLSTDGYIMCNKTLIRMFGADCAILIGELCAEYNYYNSIGELNYDDELGYMFYSTHDSIESNTGINAHFQRKAFKTLCDAGLLKIVKKGMPAKNYFWINSEALIQLFTKSTTSRSPREQQVVHLVNLNNNKNNNKNNTILDKSKIVESPEDFQLESPKKQPKQKVSFYDKCVSEIVSRFNDKELQDVLLEYLSFRLSVKDKPMGLAQWKAILGKLERFAGNKVEIVRYSLERGYLSLYEPHNSMSNNVKDVFSEYNTVKTDKHTDTGGNYGVF